MTVPWITTLIPAFPRSESLRRVLRRMLQQTYPHFKILILDDASGDETLKLAAEETGGDLRVSCIHQPKNLCLSAKYEYGLSFVDTPYFTLLGEGDFPEVDLFEKCLAGFQRHPDSAFAGGRCLVTTDRGEPLMVIPGFFVKTGYSMPPERFLPMFSGNLIDRLAIAGFVFQTDRVRKIGAWKAMPDYPFDIDLLWRLSSRFSYFFSDEILLIASMQAGAQSRTSLPLMKGWIEAYRNFSGNNEIPMPVRSIAAKKFLGQLKRAFTKIWFRSALHGNWEQVYIAADLIGEELGQAHLKDVLFRTGQFFRKNGFTPRFERLRRNLESIDRKQRQAVLSKAAGYWDALQDAIK